MQKFLSELQRRKVFRVASGYVVAGWVILQVALSLQAAMKLPDWFSTVIVSLLIIGFPVAVIVSWFFEFTPDGIKRTVPSGEVARFKPQTTDFALAAALVLVLAAVVVQLTTPPAAVTTSQRRRRAEPAVSAASIAVLPFADLSPAKDQEYFSQGIAEEILNVLANVSGLEVASRTSSFQFKGQEKIGVPLIAQQLRVRHILEGSVRKAGDTIRITAQLIDAKTDKHLWSQTFDRTMTTENIFAIQDEITKAIVSQLSSRIGAQPIAAPAARSADTENADAYALFLEGQTRFVLRGQENIKRSMSALERAIEIDPGFARAWASNTYSSQASSTTATVSIAEEEAPSMGVNLTGQYAAWNYFQSVKNPANEKFIKAFQAKYGANRPTSDPMEAAYTSLYLYKAMVEKAKSFCVDAINASSDGVTFDAPEGTVKVIGENHHITKTGLIGQINSSNQFDIVWKSEAPIVPDPFLKTYKWWNPNG